MVILITSSSSSKAEFTRIFYDVFDVGRLCRFFSVGGFTPLFCWHTFLASSYYNKLRGILVLGWRFHSCFDATRRLVSNKLEFAQFGAHMQKLWQFWFPVEYSCFRGSGFRMVPAVVPRYPAVVPLRGHKRQYRSAAVVLLVGPQQ